MRPVAQLIDSAVSGDCFRACVASILEIDPLTLPNISDKAEIGDRDWMRVMNGAIAKYNLALVIPSNGTHFTEMPFYISAIQSPRYEGSTHAVVVGYDEKRDGMSSWYVAWDPSPWRDHEPERRAEFYAKPLHAYIFVSVDPSRR